MDKTKAEPLIDIEIRILIDVFPDLSWMSAEDWQGVAAYKDWRAWLDYWDLRVIPGSDTCLPRRSARTTNVHP